MFSRWPIRVLLTGTVLFGVGIGLLMAAIPNQASNLCGEEGPCFP